MSIGTRRARHWSPLDAVGSQLHVSEWTFYGVFVDHVMDSAAASFSAATSLCHGYWDSVPLTVAMATDFLAQIADHDVAVVIHSKSGTPTHRASAGPRSGCPRSGSLPVSPRIGKQPSVDRANRDGGSPGEHLPS